MKQLKKGVPIVLSFIIILAVWQSAIWIGGFEEVLFPPPLKVGIALLTMISDGSIFEHIQISFYRFFTGYFIAVVVAIVLGLILGRLGHIWSVIDPIVQVLRPVSPIAWSPFIVLWFGIGDLPAIVIIFIAAFFPVLLSTVSAVKRVDRVYLRVAANFELKRTELITKIILPASFPTIANGLRMALGSAWIFLVAGEMVGAQSGLGFLIVDARNAMKLDLVMSAIIVIGVIGLILDTAIRRFEAWVAKIWGGQQA